MTIEEMTEQRRDGLRTKLRREPTEAEMRAQLDADWREFIRALGPLRAPFTVTDASPIAPTPRPGARSILPRGR
jgi:hypothetical protein